MQTRTPHALVVAAALALFAGGCTDAPTTAPAARAPGEHGFLSTSSSGPTLVSTAIKYRDEGGKPATGRSGNAMLHALALLDKEGTTTLAFHSYHASSLWPAGRITRAQIKTSSPDGQHKLTRNLAEPDPSLGPPFARQVLLGGLGRGDQIELRANVEGVDAPRIDVVTATETVKRLPDLAVDMTAPAEVEANTYVNILSVIREQNGDMGARAECEMYIAGELVDHAYGVWVDAGDAVTCATTFAFPAPGTYPVEVRVHTLGNWDWDDGNNTDTATIVVHGETPRFYTSASFTQNTTVDSSTSYSAWQNAAAGYGSENRSEYALSHTDQVAYMSGYMPARMAGPVDLRVSMSTGGRMVDLAEWTHPGQDEAFYGWCADRWGGRAMFWLCSGGGVASPWTSFTYAFTAGAVTYHSEGYSRVWDDLDGTESVYHWNDDDARDDTAPLGEDWTFSVRLNTPGGEHDLSRTLQLVRSGWSRSEWSYPYTCTTWEEPGYSSTNCSGWSRHGESIYGYSAD